MTALCLCTAVLIPLTELNLNIYFLFAYMQFYKFSSIIIQDIFYMYLVLVADTVICKLLLKKREIFHCKIL